MARPTRYPDWANNDVLSTDGAPNKVEIPTAVKNTGMLDGQPLSRPHLNEHFNLVGRWVRELTDQLDALSASPDSIIISRIYPVGAYWISDDASDPNTQLTVGFWVKLAGRTIIGEDTGDVDFKTVGSTGGARTHSHENNLKVTLGGGHEHTVPVLGWGNLQVNGKFRESQATAGRLITHSGLNEKSERWESMGEAGGLASGADVGNDHDTDYHGDHTHPLQGGTSTASNLPPFRVTNIWRRIA